MDEIVKQPPSATIIRTFDDAERAARAMAASGFFADSHQAAQAVVKIMAGLELGFGPFASMTGVHIIQNKPVLAANLMAAAVKRTGKYNYRVATATDTLCEIIWLEAGQEVGRSTYSIEEAQRAGLAGKENWKRYPSDMLFARAISRGQKRYAPDVFNGATVYTPDELGAQVDEEGNAIIQAPAEFQGEWGDESKSAPSEYPAEPAGEAMTPEATVKAATAKKPAMPETLPQRLVREGIVDNIPHASKLLNLLVKNKLAGTIDQAVKDASIYEAWRKVGKEQNEAIVMTQTGKYPEAEPA